jgi:copper chaperone CopZ
LRLHERAQAKRSQNHYNHSIQKLFRRIFMPRFQVEDMTCKHCEASISKAIQEVDAQASITVDLAAHSVTINSTQSDAALEAAIREAGFTPLLLNT